MRCVARCLSCVKLLFQPHCIIAEVDIHRETDQSASKWPVADVASSHGGTAACTGTAVAQLCFHKRTVHCVDFTRRVYLRYLRQRQKET